MEIHKSRSRAHSVHNKGLLLLLMVYFTQLNCSETDLQLEINTLAGTFKGSVLRSFSNKEYLAFRGMPYARPPVGELRFEKPRPPPKIEGVYDATKAGPVCLQPQRVDIGSPGQEDCLYLNVFTPLQYEQPVSPRFKVLVYIHGGAFFMGSGNEYVPGDLVTQGNIIVVTLNYRLSWLGFLKGATPLLPGNQGLWDQLMALNWIKDNIGAFGGDPSDITIAGESMGGESVSLWSILKQGKDLFKKGIVMSGTMTSCPSTPGSSDILLDLLLDRVGCWPEELKDLETRSTQQFSESQMSEVVSCLRKLPEETFVLPAEGSFTNKFTTIDGDLIPAHIPDLVKDVEYLKDVGFFSKEFIVTLVNYEGAPFSQGIFAEEKGNDSMVEYLKKKMRLPLRVVKKSYEWYENLYATTGMPSTRVPDDLWVDCILVMPTLEFLDLHVQDLLYKDLDSNRGQSFLIWFDLYPDYNPGSAKGTFHEIDLTYIFDLTPNFVFNSFYGTSTEKEFSEEDWKLKEKLIDIIADFMRNGQPDTTLSQNSAITWPSYEKRQQFYLSFSTDMSVERFPLQQRRMFWKEILPEWLQNSGRENEGESSENMADMKDEL